MTFTPWNGKKERWYKTLKVECIRLKTPLSVDDARRLVAEFVNHYNHGPLHSAIAYIAPADKLAGRAEAIWQARKHKLAMADARRRAKDQGEGNGPATVP
jgi:transposase InsO family protein